MGATSNMPFAHAMAFYHQDGLPAAWQHATKFAGKGGRLATMPDIVAARLATKPGDEPWETYYTTLTAEYYGIGASGKLLLIIAHGVGPLATLDGIRQAYSWQYKDENRDRWGGRITQKEFLDLEAGKFGPVHIVEYEPYCRRYQYPFIQILRASEALTDPVLLARFGPQADEYVRAHAAHARAWHREQAGIDPEDTGNTPPAIQQCYLDRRRTQHRRDGEPDSDPYIIQLGDANNCSYSGSRCRIPEKGLAIAHLVATGRLAHVSHEGNESLVLDVSCHEWSNGVRLVAMQRGGSVRSGIKAGPDASKLLLQHWRELLLPVTKSESIGFRALVKVGDQWFTQYPKKGERMDTWEPEYVVKTMEKIGTPILFRTTVGGGYYGFFRFGINEVQAIAGPSANAYVFVSDPQIEWNGGNPTHHTAMAQFYRIEVDTTKRLMRSDDLCHDYETMMRLLQKSA